jgi:dehydrogenase/reductase SDR family member 4
VGRIGMGTNGVGTNCEGMNGALFCRCSCHVANAEDRQRLLQTTLEHFGRVNILVNNAGINPIFGDLMEVEETAWDKLFDVNVKAGFLMSKLFAPEIQKSG